MELIHSEATLIGRGTDFGDRGRTTSIEAELLHIGGSIQQTVLSLGLLCRVSHGRGGLASIKGLALESV